MALVDLAPLGEFALASALVLLIYAWLVTGGAVVNWLAANVPSGHIGIPGVGGVNLFGWLHSGLVGFNSLAQNAYYFWLDAAKSSWNAWIIQVGAFVSQITSDYHFYATETLAALHWLRRTTIPTLVSVSVTPIWAAIHALQHLERATVTDVTHVVKPVIQSITRDITQRITRVERITKVVATTTVTAAAAAIPNPWGVIHGIDETLKETINRVARIRGILTPAGIVGLVGAAVFEAFDLGWLRCRGVGRAGKALCGLSGLIESLFLDAVDALALTDLCWMIESASVAASYISPVITEYGDDLNKLLKCRGIKIPVAPPLTTTALPAPSVVLSFGLSAP